MLVSRVGIIRLKILNIDKDIVLIDILYILLFLVNLFSKAILYYFEDKIYRKTSILRDKQEKVICKVDILVEGLFLKARAFYKLSNQSTILYTSSKNTKVNQRLWHRQLRYLR